MKNFVKTVKSENRQYRAKHAAMREGVTTMTTVSRAKWLEAQSTLRGDEIVCSAWEHAAVNNGRKLTTCDEHKELTIWSDVYAPASVTQRPWCATAAQRQLHLSRWWELSVDEKALGEKSPRHQFNN